MENLKKIDTTLFILIFSICIIGGLTVFSTTYFPDKIPSRAFFNQILFYIIGFFAFLSISTFNYKKLNNRFLVFSIFFITIILLIAVLAFGEYVFDAKRWIDIGPFTLQPSELTKISMIIIAAFALTIKEKIEFEKIFNIYEIKRGFSFTSWGQFLKTERFIKFMFSFLCLMIFIVLIMLQKSLGNTLLLCLIYFFVTFMSLNINAKFIGAVISIFLGLNLSFKFLTLFGESSINFAGIDLITLIISILLVMIISKFVKFKAIILLLLFIPFIFVRPVFEFTYNNILETYQRNRIETFLNPDPSIQLSTDYNRTQAIRAIGSGQILGKGFLNGNIVKLNLLPFAFTDFAFAAYAEQFGFIGSIILIFLYFLLIFKILLVGNNAKDEFGKYIAFGIASMIMLNTIQHIGMNLGLLPITGVPLPLISSGGSAILTIFIGLGLVQSIQIIEEEEEEEEVTNFKTSFGIRNN